MLRVVPEISIEEQVKARFPKAWVRKCVPENGVKFYGQYYQGTLCLEGPTVYAETEDDCWLALAEYIEKMDRLCKAS